MSARRVKACVLDASALRKVLIRMAHEILEKHPSPEKIALIGVRSRGELLAQRLANLLKEIRGSQIQVGALDVTMYRDDLNHRDSTPLVHSTEIPFDISGHKVIIVDDVLYTGRTIRAAMDALADLGRPDAIELAILVDRGHRELPIKADYVGKNIPTAQEELVQVHLVESDGIDEVLLKGMAA